VTTAGSTRDSAFQVRRQRDDQPADAKPLFAPPLTASFSYFQSLNRLGT